MADVSEMELDLLKRQADTLGLYVNTHRDNSLVNMMDGKVLYLQRKKKWTGDHPASILKYAAVDDVQDYLTRSTPKASAGTR
jgi:hypothetical protein